MLDVINIERFNILMEPFTVALKDFEQLASTPFRLNALNGVYAPAKTGKTYFVLEQLNSIDKELYHTIWLDGDRNSELKDRFENIFHYPIGNTKDAFEKLIIEEYRYDNFIFILDSFKDFTFGYDTDGNSSCQNIFTIYQKLLDKGATLIVIFHATKIRDSGEVKNFKIKGNEDTIESKIDFMFKLERTEEYTKLTVQCARDVNLRIGQELIFCNRDILAHKIKEIVLHNPEISLRDLKREKGLTPFSSVIDEFNGILYTIIEVKADGGRGKPKQSVKLLD